MAAFLKSNVIELFACNFLTLSSLIQMYTITHATPQWLSHLYWHSHIIYVDTVTDIYSPNNITRAGVNSFWNWTIQFRNWNWKILNKRNWMGRNRASDFGVTLINMPCYLTDGWFVFTYQWKRQTCGQFRLFASCKYHYRTHSCCGNGSWLACVMTCWAN